MPPIVMVHPEGKKRFAFLQSRRVDYEMILRIPKLRTATALAACSKSRLAYLAAVECVARLLSQGAGTECRQDLRDRPWRHWRQSGGVFPVAGRLSPLVEKGAGMWTSFA
jgi:hypothetical protein